MLWIFNVARGRSMVSRVSRGMRVESAAARVGADRSGARFQNRAT
jgi:hypothetical protein